MESRTSRQDLPVNKDKPKGTWNEINTFAQITCRYLKAWSEMGVWLSLWTRTDRQTGLAKVSVSTLAQDTGCSRQSAHTAIKSLIDKGLAKQVQKGRT